MRQLRCLENEIMEKGNRNLNILHEVLTQDLFRGATYPVYEASARRFFSLARRGFCVRREHTRWYVTKRAKNATRLEEKISSTGAIAQLGERLPCTQEVGGSIPPGSTSFPQIPGVRTEPSADVSVLA